MAIDLDENGIVYLLIEEYNQQLSHLSPVSNHALYMIANCYCQAVYPNLVNLTEDSNDSIVVFKFLCMHIAVVNWYMQTYVYK